MSSKILKEIKYKSSYRGSKEADFLLKNFVSYYLKNNISTDYKSLLEILNMPDETIFDALQNKNSLLKKNYILKELKKFKDNL